MDGNDGEQATGAGERQKGKVVPFPRRAWWRRLWADPAVRETVRVGTIAILGNVLAHLKAGEHKPEEQPTQTEQGRE